MNIVATVCIVFFALLAFIVIQSRRYANPYKLIMVFGKKGSGKTTLLTKLSVQHTNAGQKVYSTVSVPGTYKFDVNQMGYVDFGWNNVIMIDEVGMIWDNRFFKNFRPEVRDWFKLQRHRGNTVYLFSQTFDIDIKLRNLTDAMYLCECKFNFLSIARKIRRDIVIVEPTGESESRIADSLEFVPIWLSLFGARSAIFTYIPKWVKLFDSFEAPRLKPVQAEYQEIPEQLHKFYKIKKEIIK